MNFITYLIKKHKWGTVGTIVWFILGLWIYSDWFELYTADGYIYLFIFSFILSIGIMIVVGGIGLIIYWVGEFLIDNYKTYLRDVK